jgi:transcription elongation factor GreB
MEAVTVVDRLPEDQSKVFFGAWVTLEDEDGNEKTYQIVGPDEFNVALQKLSMDAPLARAMMGKRVEDEIVLKKPEGEEFFYIARIEYKPYDQD